MNNKPISELSAMVYSDMIARCDERVIDMYIGIGDMKSAMRWKWRLATARQGGCTIAPKAPTLRLKRTFNQPWPDGTITKYWRIVGPANHPQLNSDLSVQGLEYWNLIPKRREPLAERETQMKQPMSTMEKSTLVTRGETKFQQFIVSWGTPCLDGCRCNACFQAALDHAVKRSDAYTEGLGE